MGKGGVRSQHSSYMGLGSGCVIILCEVGVSE